MSSQSMGKYRAPRTTATIDLKLLQGLVIHGIHSTERVLFLSVALTTAHNMKEVPSCFATLQHPHSFSSSHEFNSQVLTS